MSQPSSIVAPTAANIARAAQLLLDGRLVAFPTETVYGLGADARSEQAVAAIFAAKGRPRFNPLIVHVASLAAARELGAFDARALKLAEAFWPGPLTVVVPRLATSGLSWLASAGLETIAIRCPKHPVAQSLLAAFAGPIAAPSANRSGTVTATTARHVWESLGASVDLILDGGPTTHGLESTIVGLAERDAALLRPGAIAREDIERLIGPLSHGADREDAPHSPGRLRSHYATAAPLRLNATDVGADETLLAFGKPLSGAKRTLNLSASGDLREAAANLFAMLRELDRPDIAAIAVMPVPESGLGEAINDRLKRAAAPRDED
ncbi:MAG: threonylcarbamoyl-AMP synthase [Alphaproteobacteria bacterium]|nr:threonylcarbamoyl-AMP synthase [Alphaproteobacteria bacterium]